MPPQVHNFLLNQALNFTTEPPAILWFSKTFSFNAFMIPAPWCIVLFNNLWVPRFYELV